MFGVWCLRAVLLELHEVEVHAALLAARRAGEEARRGNAEREPRRERERLLRTGEHEVERPTRRSPPVRRRFP